MSCTPFMKLKNSMIINKHLILFVAISVLSTLQSCQKNDDKIDDLIDNEETLLAVDVGDSRVPYLVIDTEGVPINNEPKVGASMKIFENKKETKSVRIGIEYRGSTSFRLSDKKSYGLEVWDEIGQDTNDSFFGFPDEEDWILMGHVVSIPNQYIWDRTLLYHYIGYEWSRMMGRYASRCQFVELQLNDVYQGVYIFMEKLKRDGDRINIQRITEEDITGGYILKIDKTAGGSESAGQPLEYFLTNWGDDHKYNALNSFRSNFDVLGNPLDYGPYQEKQPMETYFLYEYPKAEEISSEAKDYISSYIHQFETALTNDDFSQNERSYADFIDVDSFVDYFILTELCRNVDAYRLSTYLQKDAQGKLAMGPIWDLNIGYDSGDRIPWDGWVYQYNEFVGYNDLWLVPFWWTKMMEDSAFKLAIKVRWQALRSNQFTNLALLQSIDNAAGYLQDNGAVNRNYALWGQGMSVNYDESIQSLKNYVTFRLEWMDGEIANF